MRKDSPAFRAARECVDKYLEFPDLTWRERFRKLKAQIVEYDSGKAVDFDQD